MPTQTADLIDVGSSLVDFQFWSGGCLLHSENILNKKEMLY